MATIKYKFDTPESIGEDVNMTINPYFSIVTAVNGTVTMSGGVSQYAKKIRNTGGQFLVIDFTEGLKDAATDTLTLANNAWVIVCYIFDENTEEAEWVLLDQNTSGVTLS